ncbi:MAG TPA: bifunctional UDP-4-keto-pentose/UDP-xylose synthase [Deltaproteobacteria bacterium]|nr:bifunctional UDP-4-keto-pentose/UDP-xylose synthase [Deltaproteobacteria bacterium]HPR53620.1 bifunctional UDP-4-keto-pentose/UDP-xylose synthase [Deltaproteobacteria bacterium]
MNVLILGVNGFIGSHLSERIMRDSDWHVYGMDLGDQKLKGVMGDPRFHYIEGDIAINKEWIEYHIKKCDVVLPLVAIATPKTYVERPLSVFELDFEENLRIIRQCVKYGKRVIFPSTSEVYGMCTDESFDEYTSPLILGPIPMQRWIYSCSKQLLDRVIWAYGERGELDFTLIRPFNWIGPRLDSLETAKEGSSRVVTQFIASMVFRSPIALVDGGMQSRSFTYIDDGMEALMKILHNESGRASKQIFNIGNPANNITIKDLAYKLLDLFRRHPMHSGDGSYSEILYKSSGEFYGKGYQDIQTRVPSIQNAQEMLGWAPKVPLDDALKRTLDSFLEETASTDA